MHEAAKHVRTCRSECDNAASKQSWREPACRRASAARFVLFSKSLRKSKSARPANIYYMYMLYIQRQAAGDARRICLYFLSISVRYNTIHSFSYSVHACMIDARGVRVGFLEHGALGVCKSSVCTYNYVPLSASFIRIVLMCYSFPCDRNVAGGSRPRSEAPYITEEKNCLPYPVPVSPLVGTNYYIS